MMSAQYVSTGEQQGRFAAGPGLRAAESIINNEISVWDNYAKSESLAGNGNAIKEAVYRGIAEGLRKALSIMSHSIG